MATGRSPLARMTLDWRSFVVMAVALALVLAAAMLLVGG